MESDPTMDRLGVYEMNGRAIESVEDGDDSPDMA
jgi:hypothetical protein